MSSSPSTYGPYFTPDEPPSPEGPRSRTTRRRWVWIVVVAVVVLALAATAIVGLGVLATSTDGHADDPERVGAESWTTTNADALVAGVEDEADWGCYDTVPGSLQRCFYADGRGGTGSLTVSRDGDDLEEVELYFFAGPDSDRVSSVVRLITDTVLDGQADALLSTEAAGDVRMDLGDGLVGYLGGSNLQVKVEGWDRVVLDPEPLPPVATVVDRLERAGFRCAPTGSESRCVRGAAGVSARTTMAGVDLYSVDVEVDADSTGPALAKARDRLAAALDAAGFSDPRVRRFLAEGNDGARADIAGASHTLTLTEIGDTLELEDALEPLQ